VHQIRQRLLGPRHPDTLDALINFSITVGRCGADDEAHRIKSEVYDTVRYVYGDEHPLTLDALNNLAATVLRLPDREAARHMFQQVYQERRRLLGARAATADAAENLAVTVDGPEHVSELLTDAYRIRLRAQGPPHPATERTLRRLLTTLLRQAGEPAATAPVPAVLEAEVVEVLPAGMELGEIRLDDERMDERIELLDLAIQVYDARLAAHGPDDPKTMAAVCYLAHAHAALGQMDRQVEEAWTLIDDAAEGLESILGTDDPAARTADELRSWIASIGSC
jgi:Tetratricopeptide repeat